MLLTRKEAESTWCPMVRIMFVQQGGGCNSWSNKSPDGRDETNTRNPDRCRCIASDCAMWRWTDVPLPPEGVRATKDWKGYCGLAGKPEAP